MDALLGPPGVAPGPRGPPCPLPWVCARCLKDEARGHPVWRVWLMGPLPDAITALLLQSHHLCSISETGRKGIRPDLPSPVGGLGGRRGRSRPWPWDGGSSSDLYFFKTSSKLYVEKNTLVYTHTHAHTHTHTLRHTHTIQPLLSPPPEQKHFQHLGSGFCFPASSCCAA